MNSRCRSLATAAIVIVVANAGLLSPISAGQSDADSSAALKKFKSETQKLHEHWKRELAKAADLQARGVVSDADVDRIRLQLAVIRHDIATAHGDLKSMRGQCREIVQIREGQLKRTEYLWKLRAASVNELESRRRRLANARYRLALIDPAKRKDLGRHLQEIIKLCQSDWQRLSALFQEGAAAASMVERSHRRLVCARWHLARAQKRNDEAVAQLRKMESIDEAILRQTINLYNRDAETATIVDFARRQLAVSQERLAAQQNNSKDVVTALGNLVKLLEKSPQRKTTTETEITQRRLALAFARFRLALAAKGKIVHTYGDIAELDN